MLIWNEIERDPYYFSKRRSYKATTSLNLYMPDVSDISKLREKENYLYIQPYSFWLTELDRSPHDDDPYRCLLIANHSLHYYVRTLEDGKEVAERIYKKLQEFYLTI